MIIACLLSSSLGDAIAHAQDQAVVRPEVRLALASATRGRNVVVKMLDGTKVRGKFESIEGDRLAVRVNRAFRGRQLRTYALSGVSEVHWHMSDLALTALSVAIAIPLAVGGLALMLRPGH